ncbi:MAG: hypothetical protein LBP53_05200 [Candidatus Peribacteria bacterium]|jgi:hypothetical protein|nr:hypothetical protein [Candidatus Peribacteria bacterium]
MTSLKDWGHNLFVAQAKENGKSGTDIYIEDPRNTAGYRAWQAFAATRPQEANAVYK